MTDVVADRRYQQGQGIEGGEKGCDWTFRLDILGGIFVRRQRTDVQEEAEYGLQHIDGVSEVVVEDKGIVRGTARKEKRSEFT